ncbi:MAG: hypothetical protein RTU92_12485 [Candidatus Thorarchaeota archaeon]
MSTLRELELERVSPRLLEVLRRQGLASLTEFQKASLEAGIIRGNSQILVSYDYDEAYQIAEIALLNLIASNVRAKVLVLCPNPHQAEKRLQSLGHKCRRLGVEITSIIKRKEASEKDLKTGRVIIGTFRSLSIAMRSNPAVLEGVELVLVNRLDLIGQPNLGPRLESLLVTIMGTESQVQYLALCPPVADIEELSSWLRATIVTDPTPDIRRIYSVKAFDNVNDSLADLTEFVHYRQGQIAILCSDMETCENLATHLSGAESDPKFTPLDLRLTAGHEDDLRVLTKTVMEHYPDCDMTTKLGRNLARGVAFIHEGVSKTQRRAISAACEQGLVPVIVMPTRFAIASGIKASVVFLIGVFTQTAGEDLSKSEDLTMLSEWQVADVLASAGRPKQDNEAFGIVVVDRDSERHRVLAKYFVKDAEGNISPRLGEVDSFMDDSENIQDLALTHLCGRLTRTESLFSVIDRTYWAASNRAMTFTDDGFLEAEDTSVETLVSLRSTKSTIKRSEEIPDDSVKVVSVTPSKIAGLVRSSSRDFWHHVVLKAEEGVTCSCESWKFQGIKKHRLCKHLVKFSRFVVKDVDTRPYANAVLQTALWGLEIVGELQQDGLLVQEGKTMRCTKLGNSVAVLGVPIRDARIVMKALSTKEKGLRDILPAIVGAGTGIPKKLVRYIIDRLPAESIESLVESKTGLPGIVENCLEETHYAIRILSKLMDKSTQKSMRKESKKLESNISELLAAIS